MTPKEKAQELFKRYIEFTQEWDELDGYIVNKYNAKQCALIALEFANEFADDSYRSCYGYKHTMEYLEQVKQEIEKL